MKDKNIKYNLDEELKKESITVSEELIQRTLHAIESGEPSNLQKYQMTKQKETVKKESQEKQNQKKQNQIQESQSKQNSFKKVPKERVIQEKNEVEEKRNRKEQEKIKFSKRKKIQEKVNFKIRNNWKQLRKASMLVAGIFIILVGTHVIRIVEDGNKEKNIEPINADNSNMDAIPQQASESMEEYRLNNTTQEDAGLLGGTLRNSEDNTSMSGADNKCYSEGIQSNIEENETSDNSTDSTMERNTQKKQEDKLENESESNLYSIEDRKEDTKEKDTKEKDTTQAESESQGMEESQKSDKSLWAELGLTRQEIKAIIIVGKENEFINDKEEEIRTEKKQFDKIEETYQELNQYQLKEKIEIDEIEYEKRDEIEQEIYLYTTQEKTEGIKIEIRKDYLIIEEITTEKQKSRNIFLYERKESLK